jgi:hypothetical protein
MRRRSSVATEEEEGSGEKGAWVGVGSECGKGAAGWEEGLNRPGERACARAAVNETARRSLAGVGGEHGQKDGDK